jgi:hypothetical protein
VIPREDDSRSFGHDQQETFLSHVQAKPGHLCDHLEFSDWHLRLSPHLHGFRKYVRRHVHVNQIVKISALEIG